MLPVFNFFGNKHKKRDFLILEIGLERISCSIFTWGEKDIKLSGVGRKKFSSPEEVFDSSLEALDSLAAIVPDFPRHGIIGISGGSLETTTTIARYTRPKPKSVVTAKETESALNKVITELDTGEKKVFFSTIAGAKIDNIKVSNPIGLKGEKVELSCFAAFKDASEIALLDRLANEIDLSVERIIPSGFAVAQFLERKNLKDVLIFRAGMKRSELTLLVGGHVSEILPVDLGVSDPELLPLSWISAIKSLEKEERPAYVWLYSDTDDVNLEKLQESFLTFPWNAQLGYSMPPKIQTAQNIHNFTPSDMGVYALSQEEIEHEKT